jgi:hypothetical protein
MEIGLYTFGERTRTGLMEAPSAPSSPAEILAAAKLADQAGFDVLPSASITGSISRSPQRLSSWPRSRK